MQSPPEHECEELREHPLLFISERRYDMVDKEKVRLMTQIAIYEKKEENRNLVMSRYFKEDYVKYNCLKTMVVTTICYWLVVGIYIAVRFEKLLMDAYTMDYFKVMSGLMLGYVAVLGVFFVYTFVVFSIRFYRVKPGLVRYNRNLRRLIRVYKREERGVVVRRSRQYPIKVSSNIGDDDPELDKILASAEIREEARKENTPKS